MARRTRSSRGMSSSTDITLLRNGPDKRLSRYSDALARPRPSPCSNVKRAASMSGWHVQRDQQFEDTIPQPRHLLEERVRQQRILGQLLAPEQVVVQRQEVQIASRFLDRQRLDRFARKGEVVVLTP